MRAICCNILRSELLWQWAQLDMNVSQLHEFNPRSQQLIECGSRHKHYVLKWLLLRLYQHVCANMWCKVEVWMWRLSYIFLYFFLGTGHFTQVVWKNTRDIGIGKAFGKDGRVFVCVNYHPPGNVIGRFKDNVQASKE